MNVSEPSMCAQVGVTYINIHSPLYRNNTCMYVRYKMQNGVLHRDLFI